MIARLRLLKRFMVIESTLARFGLDTFLWQAAPLKPIAWLRHLRIWRGKPTAPLGQRIRMAIEELGPIFVKFGQAVSVRRDLLPDDIADELAKLQDQVPPFPGDAAVRGIESTFGQSIDQIFAEFDREPMAAASIAQVHRATLKDGADVVVKILRPNVQRMIRRDLDVLYLLAKLAKNHLDHNDRLHPVEVVQEFEKTLLHELDLMREAANAAQLRRNFEGSDLLYVPKIYWDYCRTDVLTMERIDGIPISAMDALVAAEVNIRRLAENGVEIFFTQVFKHNFFHADMHPGNIFVDPSDPARPKYVAVDFGIVGTLSPEDQRYLAENFLAFFRRDYRRVATLHIDSGWVPADTRPDELEAAVRAVCEPIFNKPLKDISFGLVLLRLFSAARAFQMEVQPQLVLLQKTLLAIEGLGRQLYPELDLWQTAHPILETWVKQRKDPRQIAKQMLDAWPDVSEDLLQLPQLVRRHLRSQSQQPQMPVLPPRTRTVADYWPASVILISGIVWIGFIIEPLWLGWAASSGGLLWLASLVVKKP